MIMDTENCYHEASISNTDTNWNHLPNEMKFMVVDYMDRDTRTSLKMCSHHDKLIIEATPARVLPLCIVEYTGKYYSITLFKNQPEGTNWRNNYSTFIEVNTLRQLEINLKKELSHYDCIEQMQIQPPVFTQLANSISKGPTIQGPIQLSSQNYFLKVKQLDFHKVNAIEIMCLLKQFDPNYLERLYIGQNCNLNVPQMYDMPQVMQADHLLLCPNCIEDDQLMNLSASEISLNYSANITCAGVNSFIKKSLLELDCKDVEFVIDFQDDEKFMNYIWHDLDIESSGSYFENDVVSLRMIVDSKFPDFQLDLKITPSTICGRRVMRP